MNSNNEKLKKAIDEGYMLVADLKDMIRQLEYLYFFGGIDENLKSPLITRSIDKRSDATPGTSVEGQDIGYGLNEPTPNAPLKD